MNKQKIQEVLKTLELRRQDLENSLFLLTDSINILQDAIAGWEERKENSTIINCGECGWELEAMGTFNENEDDEGSFITWFRCINIDCSLYDEVLAWS